MHYTLEATLGQLLKNPVGADLVHTLFRESGLVSIEKLILNSAVKALRLKHLQVLTRKFLDPDLLQVICDKMNTYNKESLPDDQRNIKKKWWKEGVCYQIYPRSFMDSNGDGIGDLQGIISKLDYLKGLGVDTLWLSPIYDSPNDDNGYDIRDYQKIMKEFGTMDDFEELIKGVHSRNMHLIMDLVINHTSDEHYWFKEARKGGDNPYHDYYLWRKGSNHEAPNNWTSIFQGSAWGYEQELDEYYLHLFSKKQVDLNWDNPKLRQELYSMVNWWLDKGVDGFRLDVINFISKEDGLPNGNKGLGAMTGVTGIEHYVYGPRVHTYLQELNEATFSRYDVMTVGECQGVGPLMGQYFTHEDRGELNMIFDFSHMTPPGKEKWDDYSYTVKELANSLFYGIEKSNKGCWPTLFFENHDFPRFTQRLEGADEYYERLCKLVAILQLTLPGTPFIYQGQEIGMKDPVFNAMKEFKDIETINKYNELKKKGRGGEEALRVLRRGSRDNARVPIPWTDEAYGGFSEAQPWLWVDNGYKVNNVKKAVEDDKSIYHFYKALMDLRKKELVLIYGDFQPIKDKKNLLIYSRSIDEKELYVVCNSSHKPVKVPRLIKAYQVILSNIEVDNIDELQPYEGRIYIKS